MRKRVVVWLLALLIVAVLALAARVALVRVPDLTQDDFSHAGGLLEQAGLMWRTADGSEPHDLELVRAQSPAPGSVALRGSDVTLETEPPVAVVDVPNIVGMSEPDAQTVLIEAGLRPPSGGLIPDGTFIESQDPRPGDQVPFGTSVTYEVAEP